MRFRQLPAAALYCLSVQAQIPPPPIPPPPEEHLIRTDVSMILMHATIQDGNGKFVSGLTRDAFRVTEDGAAQEIKVFRSDDVPVVAGLVIDVSGSMARRWKDVVLGAIAFVRDSNPADETFVVHFNDKVKLGLPEGQAFSNNISEMRAAIAGGQVGGQTALYDAIALAVEHIQKATLMKRVLYVVSDGADNRSSRKFDEVAKTADRAGVLIYTIGLFDDLSEDRNPGVLRRLARQTGGVAFFPQDLSKLTEISSQIAKDVRNQYTVGFMSGKAATDAAYHEVKLTAVDQQRRQLKVRTRTGYYGAKADAPAPSKETEQPPPPSQK